MNGSSTSGRRRACRPPIPDRSSSSLRATSHHRGDEMDHRNIVTRRRFIAGLSAGAALGMNAGRASAADPITLKFATNDTTQDASYAVAQRFGTDIAKRTNDKY